MIDPTCPSCGADQGAYHANGCVLRPAGVAPCCGVPIWPAVPTRHELWCDWGIGDRFKTRAPAPDPDPWRDVSWSSTA